MIMMSLSRMLNRRTYNAIYQSSIESSSKFQSRFLSANASIDEKRATNSVHKQEWSRAISEAEKIVGSSKSLFSMQWLLNDKFRNETLHLQQVIAKNPPMIAAAKSLIYDGKNNMLAWGLIVQLISKAVDLAPTVSASEQDKSAGILRSQKVLAEITEIIRISFLIHRALVNLHPLENHGNNLASDNQMLVGNKVALLSGDYLLGNACLQLAGLRNQELMEVILFALRDLSEASFLGDQDEQNIPLPSKPLQSTFNEDHSSLYMEGVYGSKPMSVPNIRGNPEKEWILHNILSAGSLLGRGCQGAILLAGQTESLQKQGYLFGVNLSLAWQACLDLEPFLGNEWTSGTQFSLISAPVLFQLQYDPSLYDEIAKGRVSVDNIDFDKVRTEVMTGPGLEKTRHLTRRHGLIAMKILNELPSSEARTALQNIIAAMQEL